MKKKAFLILFLLIIICSLNLFSNQTLIKDYFYTAPTIHIYNRSIMMQYYGGHIRDYLYKFYSGDFMFFQNRSENWCNSIVGLLRNPDAYLFYAGKEGDYIKFNKINHSFTSKMKTDNYNTIYTLTKLDNDYMISTFSFNNEGDSIIWHAEYTANEDSCPYAFAINFNQTNSDPYDDKIWTIKDNKINLLYFEIVNYFYFTLFKKESWYNVGGIPNVKYTSIAIGKDYGVQNNYIYVYDSLHNMVLMLESGFENPYEPTLTLVSLQPMPPDWIIKSITTDYFGSVWLSEYNYGYLQSYTPDLQQALTTANWSFRANKPVSFTMAMDKPYGILTENWTDTTGLRLYKLGTEIFYDTVKQVHPLTAQIYLHFRVTVGSYMTFGVGGSYYLDSSFYLPGEYNLYFNTPYWGTGNKYWSLKAISACTNPDGTPTAVVTKTGSFSYFGPQNDTIPPNLPEHISLSGYVSNSKATDPIAHLTWTWNFLPPDGEAADYTRDSFILYRDNSREKLFCGSSSSGTGRYAYSPYESHVYVIVGFSTNQYNPWNAYNARSNSITLKYIPPPDTGCPYFYIKENGEYIPQNTIMHYGYSNKQDNYLFNLSSRYKDELRKNGITDNRFESKERIIEAAISENEVEKDYIDRVNLKAVKYDSIYNLTLNTKGEYLFWKDVYKIDSCKNAKGEDILPLVENMGDSFYIASPGDTIYIYTSTRSCDKANASGKDNRGGSIIIDPGVKLRGKSKGKDIEPSIEIEYTGGKSWVNCGEIYPREYIYSSYNDIPLLSDSIRFVINNEVKIDYISFPKAENVKYNEIKLELINPTLKGKNVMKQIIKEDSIYINLISGDTLYFSFPLITPTNGENVSYILETDGYYNMDNKRDKSESVTISKSDIKFISGIVYLQSKCKIFSNYEIYSISGRQVGQGEIKTSKIKLHKLCNGIYFIKLKGKHKSETHKFEVIR